MVAKTRSLLRRHVVLVVVLALLVLTMTAAVAVEKLGGSSMPGAHSFVPVEEMSCAECHADVAAELEANPHVAPGLSDCTFCHSPSGGAHAGSPITCSTCHSSEAVEVIHPSEAHAGMADQLGETVVDMSLTCIACHTDIEVKIKSKAQHPLEFTIGADV